jgi:hypothetical protein
MHACIHEIRVVVLFLVVVRTFFASNAKPASSRSSAATSSRVDIAPRVLRASASADGWMDGWI